jgi:hypothetical protein
MRVVLHLACAAVVLLATGCSGKLATTGGDAGATEGSSSGGGSGSSGVSSSGVTSSSSNGGGSSGVTSSGSNSGSGSGGPTDEGGVDLDGGVDCGSIPTLHPTPAGDIYCGYGADGGPIDCLGSAGAGWCCLGGALGGGNYAAQICAQNAASCMTASEGMGPVPIQCNQLSDCPPNGSPGATACCLQGAALEELAGCGYSKAVSGTEIVCEGSAGGAATSCQAGEIQICSMNADCPQGTQCTPGKWKIFQLGFCM